MSFHFYYKKNLIATTYSNNLKTLKKYFKNILRRVKCDLISHNNFDKKDKKLRKNEHFALDTSLTFHLLITNQIG